MGSCVLTEGSLPWWGEEINGGAGWSEKRKPRERTLWVWEPQTVSTASTLSEALLENALQECLFGSSALAWYGEDPGARAAGLTAPSSLEMRSFPSSNCPAEI